MTHDTAISAPGQVARYVVVGVAANALVLALYYALSLGLSVAPKTALICASTVGFVVTFLAQRIWTFRSRSPLAASLARYGLGYAGSLLLQLGLVHAGTDWIGAPHQLVVPLALAAVTVVFFLVQRAWVFSTRTER